VSDGERFKERMEQLSDAGAGVGGRWGEDVEQFYAARGLGARTGFGERPAVLVIDMAIAFNDPAYKVGADQTSAVEAIAELLPVARQAAAPVYYTTTAYHPDGRDAGMFARKVPALLELQLGDRAVEIDPRLAPAVGEHVIVKKHSSSFLGTNLLSLLIEDRVDTIIITGCSTSGCVRAACLDGVSYGFRIVVPEACVSDRAEGPHYANLFDINAKYGDVMPLEEVLQHLAGLPARP
jgi:nicotinamidase-related amidase